LFVLINTAISRPYINAILLYLSAIVVFVVLNTMPVLMILEGVSPYTGITIFCTYYCTHPRTSTRTIGCLIAGAILAIIFWTISTYLCVKKIFRKSSAAPRHGLDLDPELPPDF